MAASGQLLHLRLFLEGIEVPVIAVQVQCNVNAPATASIQVVPTDRLLELKARTMVHVFFWDYTLDLDTTDQTQATTTQTKSGTEIQTRDDSRDPLKGYKLLFSGEVVGLSMMKTPVGRQAILQCADFSTYWDTTYQFMISYGPHGNFLGSGAAVWAGGASTFNDIIDGHTSVMNSYLRSKPKTPGLQDVKGLMGGIISVLEVMGGVRNQMHGVNDFFTIAELKNHLMQQIVAEQDDDTALRLFDEKSFMEWLNRGLSSLGQLTTFRDMLKLLFQFIYYECVPNPAPKYVPGAEKQKKVVADKVYNFPNTVRNKLVELLKQATLRAGSAEFNEGATTPGQSLAVDPNAAPSSRLTGGDMKTQLEALAKTKNLIPRVKSKIELGSAESDRLSRLDRSDQDGIRKGWRLVSNYIGEALEAGGVPHSERFRKVETKLPKVDRLYTQIFRPDCFFAAPPKCNVFFPEMYTSFNFSRNFLQEVTRLRLTTGWIFGVQADGLLANIHFAPATKDIKELAKKQGNNSVRALLPWEKYSGILPKFETCAEINYIAGRSERKLGIKKQTNSKGKANDYAQRAANFNYFKYRFAARGCDVSLKFNPFVVVGFPAALITQPFSPSQDQINSAVEKLSKQQGKKFAIDDVSDNIRLIAREIGAPSHYLGMVAGLSHMVSQDGGTTSVTLTHARTHRVTDDDFLSVWLEEKSKDARKQVSSTIYDTQQLLDKGDYTGLKFVFYATDQASVVSKIQQDAQQKQDDNQNLENDFSTIDRPTGIPNLQEQTKLAPFVLLNPTLPTQTPTTAVVVENQVITDDGTFPLRGEVRQSMLNGTQTKILEPASPGRLHAGMRGPKRGKITQIQVFTDQIISLTGTDLNKFAPKTLKTKSNDPLARAKANVKDDQKIYLWNKIAIYEEVIDSTPISKTIPAEEGMRPPWFTPLYSNWFIGDRIYDPFFGCGSVVDEAVFTSPSGAATFGTSRAKQTELLAKLKGAEGDNSKIAKILDDAKANSLTDIPDVESSLDALAYLYGEVRRMGLDVHRFVHDYIFRPIATMENIFGSADLSYSSGTEGDADGTASVGKGKFLKTRSAKSPFPSSSDKLVLTSGVPGFHSTAVAPYGNLLGLTDNPDFEQPRLRIKGKKFPIAKDLDPRPGRRSAVQAYSDSLEGGTGSLGIGLLG